MPQYNATEIGRAYRRVTEVKIDTSQPDSAVFTLTQHDSARLDTGRVLPVQSAPTIQFALGLAEAGRALPLIKIDTGQPYSAPEAAYIMGLGPSVGLLQLLLLSLMRQEQIKFDEALAAQETPPEPAP